ncbi:MAG: glycoside hydrolase family 88 protein [Muribaculaceae bacterium]
MKTLRVAAAMALALCTTAIASARSIVDFNVDKAEKQMEYMISTLKNPGVDNPVSVKSDGTLRLMRPDDWRSGFFAGSLWYLYELSGHERWRTLAEKYDASIEEVKNLTSHHDVGFMIGSSFGNGYKLTDNATYPAVIVQTARSLCTRFRAKAGVIQSWNSFKHWKCPVIIDNMMNLELLFEATRLSGDYRYYNIAISHIEHTLANHFRADGSCYHVLNYDTSTGAVTAKVTAQGYADESAWSRGQAWAIYGFTMAYRYTADIRYLNQARKTFEFMRNHPNMPKDHVPLWDMDAPEANPERDASAGAIIASALLEMAKYVPAGESKSYRKYARSIVETLSSADFLAQEGSNGGFLLMHSVGSKPANSEVDVPLNYADYYYLEALKRLRDWGEK